jgi:prepilin-type N-terminal cleavage/methylation domain-containing protein
VRRNADGFTLIEIAIAVFIVLLLLTLAVPSINGVLADRRLRRSLDDLNRLVATAQERSASERRAYLISWDENQLVLHPESAMEGEETPPVVLRLRAGDAYLLKLPAALKEDPPAHWIFWPSGTCEAAQVSYKGANGTWAANFSPLTGRAEVLRYAAK